MNRCEGFPGPGGCKISSHNETFSRYINNMPELAEVEYFRKVWNPGLGQRVSRIAFHPNSRLFRGIEPAVFEKSLTGATLVSSEARGKQMIFRFNRATLGLHLGMTGELRLEPPDYSPNKHDHLVLFQKNHSLVFEDPRQFGRVLFAEGKGDPAWWKALPPDLLSKEFTREAMEAFLQRRKAAPLKAVLLMQERFPGIGNWMADEILWQAHLHPARPAGKVKDSAVLWKTLRKVCRDALRIIGRDWSDPPDDWLMKHRWAHGGTCPRCGLELSRKEIGGRTTCWCPHCQPEGRRST